MPDDLKYSTDYEVRCRKLELHFPMTFSLSWLFNSSSLSNAFIKLAIVKRILFQKIVHKRRIDK